MDAPPQTDGRSNGVWRADMAHAAPSSIGTMQQPGPVVTISASYGAGGSVVGTKVAEQLGVPFIDRSIPGPAAGGLDPPIPSALDADRRAPRLGRTLVALAELGRLSAMGFMPSGSRFEVEAGRLREQTERLLWELRETTGGVVLGGSAATVLGSVADALHVRLDGPKEDRLRQAMQIRGIGSEAAQREMRKRDRGRRAYVRRSYGQDPRGPAPYHMVIDSTAIDLDTCAGLIARAAKIRKT